MAQMPTLPSAAVVAGRRSSSLNSALKTAAPWRKMASSRLAPRRQRRCCPVCARSGDARAVRAEGDAVDLILMAAPQHLGVAGAIDEPDTESAVSSPCHNPPAVRTEGCAENVDACPTEHTRLDVAVEPP